MPRRIGTEGIVSDYHAQTVLVGFFFKKEKSVERKNNMVVNDRVLSYMNNE